MSNDFSLPTPDPKLPWALSHNDRRFLRSLKILVEPNTPWPETAPGEDKDD